MTSICEYIQPKRLEVPFTYCCPVSFVRDKLIEK